jgi:hypothetical protein
VFIGFSEDAERHLKDFSARERSLILTAIEELAHSELFVDDFLIEKRDGLELRLQASVPREIGGA